jgi:hypothetical protein
MPKGRNAPPWAPSAPRVEWQKLAYGWMAKLPDVTDSTDIRAETDRAFTVLAEAARLMYRDFGRGLVVQSLTPDGVHFIVAGRVDDVLQLLGEWGAHVIGLDELTRLVEGYDPRAEYPCALITDRAEGCRFGIRSLSTPTAAA